MSETGPVLLACTMVWQGQKSSIAAGTQTYEEECGRPATKRVILRPGQPDEEIVDVCTVCEDEAINNYGALPVADSL